MEEKKYVIEFTEQEANSIMDAVESVDDWASNDALCYAVMKIVDAMNGFEVRKALDDAIAKQNSGGAVYYSNDEANKIMRERIDRIKSERK